MFSRYFLDPCALKTDMTITIDHFEAFRCDINDYRVNFNALSATMEPISVKWPGSTVQFGHLNSIVAPPKSLDETVSPLNTDESKTSMSLGRENIREHF